MLWWIQGFWKATGAKGEFCGLKCICFGCCCPELLGLIVPQGKQRWKEEAKVLWVERESVILGWSHPCHPGARAESLIPGMEYP